VASSDREEDRFEGGIEGGVFPRKGGGQRFAFEPDERGRGEGKRFVQRGLGGKSIKEDELPGRGWPSPKKFPIKG